jgi:hypothetical protein
LSLDQSGTAHDGHMPKPVWFVAAWFAAGVVAVAVASVGVSMVGHQVIGSRPAPLSAAQVSEELAATEASPDGTGTTTSSTTTTTSPEGPPPPAATGGPGTTVTPPPTQPGASPTTVAPPAQPTTKTYDLVGGTATLRFSPSGVTVVVATPNAGFSVDVGQSHGNGVQLEFESDDHRSRVDAWWDGGPQDEVREDD